MLKNSAEQYSKPDSSRVPVAKSTQDTIEIEAIAADGIFYLGNNLWSKTYRFSDVNYAMLSEDEQIEFIYAYLKALSSLSVRFKISVMNRAKDEQLFRKQALLQLHNDGYDYLREEVNGIIESRIEEGRKGIEQDRYITLTVERDAYEAAKNYFITLEQQLVNKFRDIKSTIEELKCNDRLKVLYDFYQSGEDHNVPFHFDFDKTVESGRDFLNDIAPASIKFYDDYFVMGNQFGRAMCMRKLPAQLDNGIIHALTDTSVRFLLALDVHPMPKAVADNLIQAKYRAVEKKIRQQQKTRNKNKEYSSEISTVVQEEKTDLADIMKQVKEQDMKLSYAGLTLVIMGDSKEELEQSTEAIKSLAEGESLILGVMTMKQREGLTTVLPIGKCQTGYMRSMTTADLTAFMPFHSQDLLIPGGKFYGINKLNKNLLLGNRSELKNGNAWIFGEPGSGKSMEAKWEMLLNFLCSYGNAKNEIIVLDPNNEYAPLCDVFHGTYLDIRPACKWHINGLEIPDYIPPSEITANKVGWMTGVLEQMYNRGLIAQEKSVCERALRLLYAPYENGAISPKTKQPTMTEYRNVLLDMQDASTQDIAAEMALALELFTTGTLDMFGHEGNVDVDAPFLVYGFRDIPKDIWSVTLFIIMESLRQRVYRNYLRGVATWIYIDEAHEFLKTEQSADYIDKLWRELRKFFGFCTGITHEVSDICKNKTSKAMVNAASFAIICSQQNIEAVQDVYGFTDEEVKYVKDAEPGCGLLRHGKTILPFDNVIPDNTEVYKILNTDPDKFRQSS